MDSSRLPFWSIPFLILVVIAAAVAGFAIGGPAAGVAVGGLMIAAIAVVAVRSKPGGGLDVAGSGDRSDPLLVFALAPVESSKAVQRVAERARSGAEDGEVGRVIVVAPASSGRLHRWLSDLDPGRFDAQRTLAISIASLAKAGIDAEGRVGDGDPMLAVEDALRVHGAREVVFVALAGAPQELIGEVRERLARPLTVVEAPAVEIAAGR